MRERETLGSPPPPPILVHVVVRQRPVDLNVGLPQPCRAVPGSGWREAREPPHVDHEGPDIEVWHPDHASFGKIGHRDFIFVRNFGACRQVDGDGAGKRQQRADEPEIRCPKQLFAASRRIAGPGVDREIEGFHRADSGGFSRRERTGIDAAYDQNEQEDGRPYVLHRSQLLARRGVRACRTEVGIAVCDNRYCRHKCDDGQNAGNDADGEKPPDVGFGQYAVKDENDAWRDQCPDGAVGGDRASRQSLVIAVSSHLRQRCLAHCRRGRQARSAIAAKAPHPPMIASAKPPRQCPSRVLHDL